MDITEFKPNTNQNEPKEKADYSRVEQEELDKVKDEYGDMVELFLTKYGDMSEEELVKEMLKIVASQKRNGTFDAQKIRMAAEKIAPMLSEEQRVKMLNLLNYLG